MNKILYSLGVLCIVLAGADLFRSRHGDFSLESTPLFWCVFGFVAYVAIIFVSRMLRRLILRPEDYYGRESVDAEETDASDV